MFHVKQRMFVLGLLIMVDVCMETFLLFISTSNKPNTNNWRDSQTIHREKEVKSLSICER